jgi:hypothetical protein
MKQIKLSYDVSDKEKMDIAVDLKQLEQAFYNAIEAKQEECKGDLS